MDPVVGRRRSTAAGCHRDPADGETSPTTMLWSPPSCTAVRRHRGRRSPGRPARSRPRSSPVEPRGRPPRRRPSDPVFVDRRRETRGRLGQNSEDGQRRDALTYRASTPSRPLARPPTTATAITSPGRGGHRMSGGPWLSPAGTDATRPAPPARTRRAGPRDASRTAAVPPKRKTYPASCPHDRSPRRLEHEHDEQPPARGPPGPAAARRRRGGQRPPARPWPETRSRPARVQHPLSKRPAIRRGLVVSSTARQATSWNRPLSRPSSPGGPGSPSSSV